MNGIVDDGWVGTKKQSQSQQEKKVTTMTTTTLRARTRLSLGGNAPRLIHPYRLLHPH
jgi:hypothetical protein